MGRVTFPALCKLRKQSNAGLVRAMSVASGDAGEGSAVWHQSAKRIPVNCQRLSGWKKFRYVSLMWLRGVTQEPPRRTR